MKQMTFVAAMKDYFGAKKQADGSPGTPMSFLQEIKALTPEDKLWFRQELPKVGYEITETVSAT